MKDELKSIEKFLISMQDMDSEQMMKLVDMNLGDEGVELFVSHIQDFYGITEDEEVGTLAQIMVTGYLAGKASEFITPPKSTSSDDDPNGMKH